MQATDVLSQGDSCENITEILSIIDKLEMEDKPGLLISIEFTKLLVLQNAHLYKKHLKF